MKVVLSNFHFCILFQLTEMLPAEWFYFYMENPGFIYPK